MTLPLTRLAGPAALAVAAGALVAACGSSSNSGAAADNPVVSSAVESPATSAAVTQAATTGEAVIHIQNFMYTAPSVPLKAGVKFMVVNDDSVSHTFETADGTIDSHEITSGATATITVAKAGTYSIKCDFHPNMHGSITVS